MAIWWNLDHKTKPILHVLALLTLWLFVVVLLASEQNDGVMLRLDQVHTYQLQKQPLYYDTLARPGINSNFQTNWILPTDDVACFGQVNWTGNTACHTKRTGLVTTTRNLMGCDVTRSPGCNCINQVLRPIANDLTNYPTTNTPTGTFLFTGKNLTGQQANVLSAIEACRFLHHPSYLAAQVTTGNTLIRRVGLLFLLSTVLTGNAVVYFFFSVGARDWMASIWRTLFIVIWPIIGAAVPAFLESGASNLIMLIVLPPLLILVWYEFVLTSPHKAFFVHPYFFNVALATTAVIALVENSVGDYDNITYEIWKAHMVSALYFAVYWFTSKSKASVTDTKDFAYRAQQESVFTAVVLAVLALLTSAMAPYTDVAYNNYLLHIPLAFGLAAFIDVVYLSHLDPPIDQKSRSATETVPNTTYWISSLILVLKALVVIYYWRDYSTIYNTMNQKIPTRSLQFNVSNAWLTPSY